MESSPNNIICLRFRELLRLLLNGTRSVHLLATSPAWWDAPFQDRTFGWFFTRSEARKDADSEMITIRSMRSNGGWQTSSFLRSNAVPPKLMHFLCVWMWGRGARIFAARRRTEVARESYFRSIDDHLILLKNSIAMFNDSWGSSGRDGPSYFV